MLRDSLVAISCVLLSFLNYAESVSLNPNDICQQPIDGGSCFALHKRFAFNSQEGLCEEFDYGGCGGNENNFEIEEECKNTCEAGRDIVIPPEDKCSQPIVKGPCFSYIPRNGFFSEKGRCERFIYGGCNGNENNFESIEECFSQCGGKPPTIEIGCDRRKCDWRTFGPYLSSNRECQPIYEGGQCCPTRFHCKTRSERGLDPKKCYYRGHEYEDRLTVEERTGCYKECFCRNFKTLNSNKSIVCPILDCPSLFNPSNSSCRYIFEIDKCCETGEICDEDPSDPFDCEWEGKSYKLGDRMHFNGDDVCHECVCTKQFTDPRGPGCQKSVCGYEFRNIASFEKNCIPIHREDRCCPFKYICPNKDEINVLEFCKSQKINERESCSFGEKRIKYGSIVDVIGNCKVKCRCVTPPDLSCMEYDSCVEASERACISVNETQCPALRCPEGCDTISDLKTGCDRCFCRSLIYSCPEAKCPASCLRTEIQMNETSGCYECTCLPVKDIDTLPGQKG
ncbi:UNVERIFIED_CONTAM: hypothetical protein RMT77_005471 [Armadillidium vulgare]